MGRKKTAQLDPFNKLAEEVNKVDDMVGACKFDLGYSFWVTTIGPMHGEKNEYVWNTPVCQSEDPNIVMAFMKGFILGLQYERSRPELTKKIRNMMQNQIEELTKELVQLQKEVNHGKKKGR